MAEELRECIAELGFRSVGEMVGYSEILRAKLIPKSKARPPNFSRMFGTVYPTDHKTEDPFTEARRWKELDGFAKVAVDNGASMTVRESVNNIQCAVGARMVGWMAEHYGNNTVEPGLIRYGCTGIIGRPFVSFITQGTELALVGEANDYTAKSISGGCLIAKPPYDAAHDAENSSIVGNVAFSGAAKGETCFAGRTGEHFYVRNPGAEVVAEGIGAHDCGYTTGGAVVTLGTAGRNFTAGMSGGVAYVYDVDSDPAEKVNQEMVGLYKVGETRGDDVLVDMIRKHYECTDSAKTKRLSDNWAQEVDKFIKVYPTESREINNIEYASANTGLEGGELELRTFEIVTGGAEAAARKEELLAQVTGGKQNG